MFCQWRAAKWSFHHQHVKVCSKAAEKSDLIIFSARAHLWTLKIHKTLKTQRLEFRQLYKNHSYRTNIIYKTPPKPTKWGSKNRKIIKNFVQKKFK